MVKQVEETLGLVLESAQKEFLEKGFEKASLRCIAKNAGVTTGALYIRFPNKDALFGALVSPVTDYWDESFDEGNEQGLELLQEGKPEDMWNLSGEVLTSLVDNIYLQKDAFTLLINCSIGSSYENFLDRVIEKEVNQSLNYLRALKEKGYEPKAIEKEDLHILMSAQYYAIFEVIRHGMEKEEALRRIRVIGEFFTPGWHSIFRV